MINTYLCMYNNNSEFGRIINLYLKNEIISEYRLSMNFDRQCITDRQWIPITSARVSVKSEPRLSSCSSRYWAIHLSLLLVVRVLFSRWLLSWSLECLVIASRVHRTEVLRVLCSVLCALRWLYWEIIHATYEVTDLIKCIFAAKVSR